MNAFCEMARRARTGFHTLIGQPDQLRTMGQRCECVLEHLDRLIEDTLGSIPLRERDFCLVRRHPGPVTRGEEAKWERAMWRQWGPLGNRAASFLPVCPHLQTYQYPLKRARTDAHRGKIDLLGVSPDYLPVVVELKRAESSDTVLRMLLEMVAYGLAFRQGWSRLRVPHWDAAMWES